MTQSSNYWSPDINNYGNVVINLDDIQQSINIILTTIKGSDPLRPEFGCGLYTYIGMPINVAVPNMIREMALALQTFEPRISVTQINYQLQGQESVLFEIHWSNWVDINGVSAPKSSPRGFVTKFLLTENTLTLLTEDGRKIYL